MTIWIRTGDSKRLRLSKRDESILVYLAKHPFLTFADARKLFWNGKKNGNEITRLSSLCRAGILEPMNVDGKKVGYRLSKKGITYLPSEELKSRARALKRPGYGTSFRHDVLLQQIEVILEENPLVTELRNEHETKALLAQRHGKKERRDSGYKVPDVLFRLTTPINSLVTALELEVTAKAEVTYRRVLKEMLLSPDFELIFYVVLNVELKNLISRVLKSVRKDEPLLNSYPRLNQFYFVLLDDFLQERQNAVFEGADRSFSLASLAQ